jgi:hypothetical protein
MTRIRDDAARRQVRTLRLATVRNNVALDRRNRSSDAAF